MTLEPGSIGSYIVFVYAGDLAETALITTREIIELVKLVHGVKLYENSRNLQELTRDIEKTESAMTMDQLSYWMYTHPATVNPITHIYANLKEQFCGHRFWDRLSRQRYSSHELVPIQYVVSLCDQVQIEEAKKLFVDEEVYNEEVLMTKVDGEVTIPDELELNTKAIIQQLPVKARRRRQSILVRNRTEKENYSSMIPLVEKTTETYDHVTANSSDNALAENRSKDSLEQVTEYDCIGRKKTSGDKLSKPNSGVNIMSKKSTRRRSSVIVAYEKLITSVSKPAKLRKKTGMVYPSGNRTIGCSDETDSPRASAPQFLLKNKQKKDNIDCEVFASNSAVARHGLEEDEEGRRKGQRRRSSIFMAIEDMVQARMVRREEKKKRKEQQNRIKRKEESVF